MNTTDDATDTTSRTTVETNNGNETHAHTTRIPHAQQRKPAMSYVLYFSKPFALAIAIWPFLSLLLTLPVLALLYHRDNRLRFTSALTAYLVVLYLIALACFTMYPMPENPATYCAAHHLRPQLNPFEFIHDIRTDGITGVMQLAMNVVFFLPLGYFMKRVFRWKFATALPAMFLTSLLIETTQLTGIWGIYPCAYRLFDVDDLITNTLGGILGYAMGSIVTHFLPQQRIDEDAITTEPGFVRRCVALAIDLFLVETASLSVTALIYLVGVLVRCEPREQRQCGRLRRGHHRHVRPVRRDHSVEARRPHVGRRFHAHDGGDQGAFRHAQDRVLYVTRVGVVLRGLRIVDGPWLLRAAARHRAYRVLAR